MNQIKGNDTVAQLLRICLFVSIALILLTVLAAPSQALGVAAGAVLSVGDLWLIAVIIRGFLSESVNRRRALLLGVAAVGKIGAIFFALYIIIVHAKMGILGVFLGLTTVPIGVGILGMVGLFRRPA